MLKILTIVLSKLRNGEYFQFITDVLEMIISASATALNVEEEFTEFSAGYEKLDEELRVDQGSVLTEKLDEQDTLRDNTWTSINERIKATLVCPIEEEVEAAKSLKRVFDLYGNIRQLSYNEQTAAATNLNNDLALKKNEAHCATLGITHWVAAHRTQIDEFKDLVKQRNTEYANKNSGNVKEVRLLMDPLYEEIVNRVNAMVTLKMATPEIEIFVKELNQKIKYYENTLASRSGRKSKGEEDDLSEPDEEI